MVKCKYKKKGINIEHIWFLNQQEIGNIETKGIVFCHALKHKEKKGINKLQNSLIADLSLDEDELFQQIRKNDRYEIRRAKKEGVECIAFSSEKIKEHFDLLDEFEQVYNQMFRDKHMSVKFNRRQIETYINEKAMYFTIAYYENKPYVFHSYIYDKISQNVRLYYSCSAFRSEKEVANMIARMNKLLHWHDLCRFKEEGIVNYDWGGITNPENPNGIDQFKLGFGGKLVTYWNVITSNNICMRLLLKIANKAGIFGA